MTLVAVITVLSWRLDVALALAAELPRLALNGLLAFFGGHGFSSNLATPLPVCQSFDDPQKSTASGALVQRLALNRLPHVLLAVGHASPHQDVTQCFEQCDGLMHSQLVDDIVR
jgi:hypothetical protein